MSISILIADDHQIVRSGLRNLFDSQEDMQVVAEAEDGRMAVKLAHDLLPCVVVMDTTMPQLNGVEATRQIMADTPNARIVALSDNSDKQFVAEALKAGAMGYVPKAVGFDELAAAVRSVALGNVYVSPSVARIVVNDYVRHESKESATTVLSPREREVLQLLAEGKATKEVAVHLKISVKTLETHRAKIMEKLDKYSVAELTKYAIRQGLTSLDA
jgi:DNA-binding NarL/FixJ family response regulator